MPVFCQSQHVTVSMAQTLRELLQNSQSNDAPCRLMQNGAFLFVRTNKKSDAVFLYPRFHSDSTKHAIAVESNGNVRKIISEVTISFAAYTARDPACERDAINDPQYIITPYAKFENATATCVERILSTTP